jgi:hypothetical protein
MPAILIRLLKLEYRRAKLYVAPDSRLWLTPVTCAITRHRFGRAIMKGYEFRIFSAVGSISLIVHSQHSNDIAAIRSATAFAKGLPFEVWRASESDTHSEALNALNNLAFRSEGTSAKNAGEKEPSSHSEESGRKYEFKLSAPNREPLVFAATLMTDEQAADHARMLLTRHRDMTRAEIWRGMKLVRQV